MHYLFPIITEDEMLGGGPRQDPHGSPFRSILRSRSPSPASPPPLSAMPLIWALTMLPYNRLEALRRSVLVPIKQTHSLRIHHRRLEPKSTVFAGEYPGDCLAN